MRSVYRAMRARRIQQPKHPAVRFQPLALFKNSEPGVWYDPSDLSTLYQDAAGTTPVTAVEQPVGLMLDKSKGLALGPELVTNGTFDTDISGWTPGISSGGTIAWSNGTVLVTRIGGTTSAVQSFPVIEGRSYRITANSIFLSGASSQSFVAIRTGGLVTSVVLASQGGAVGNSFAFSFVFMAQNTATVYVHLGIGVNTGQYTFDNVSIRELPGNHAYQTTATSRPVLSARVNLLTKTEQFDDAAWVKTQRTTVMPNTVAAPDGTPTADTVLATGIGTVHVSQLFTAVTGVAYTASRFVKAGSSGFCTLGFHDQPDVYFDLASLTFATGGTGTGFVNASIKDVGGGWRHISATWVKDSGIVSRVYFAMASSLSSQVGLTVGDFQYTWGADLRVANAGANLPPYQRVNTATDYDTVGFPHYLRFDGVDDWLVTPTITPGIDKAQVFAGVRKLSDGGTGAICELSADMNNNNGTAALFWDSSGWWRVSSKGTLRSNADFPEAGPLTRVLTGLGDISGDSAILRVNGTQAASSTADQGTGNFLAYPLYIGRRGGTTLPFNGHLYSLIVRFGSNLPTATIAKTEKYINTKTRAF